MEEEFDIFEGTPLLGTPKSEYKYSSPYKSPKSTTPDDARAKATKRITKIARRAKDIRGPGKHKKDVFLDSIRQASEEYLAKKVKKGKVVAIRKPKVVLNEGQQHAQKAYRFALHSLKKTYYPLMGKDVPTSSFNVQSGLRSVSFSTPMSKLPSVSGMSRIAPDISNEELALLGNHFKILPSEWPRDRKGQMSLIREYLIKSHGNSAMSEETILMRKALGKQRAKKRRENKAYLASIGIPSKPKPDTSGLLRIPLLVGEAPQSLRMPEVPILEHLAPVLSSSSPLIQYEDQPSPTLESWKSYSFKPSPTYEYIKPVKGSFKKFMKGQKQHYLSQMHPAGKNKLYSWDQNKEARSLAIKDWNEYKYR